MKIINILITLLACLGWAGCQNEGEDPKTNSVQPGIYSTDIIIAAEPDAAAQSSRGINEEYGEFTSDYESDHIYIHSKTDPDKVIKISVKSDIQQCGDCKGFPLTVEAKDDGSYTINGTDFAADEEIYFSNTDKSTWEATSTGKELLDTDCDILEQGENTEEELLRSEKNYDLGSLQNMIENDPTIDMSRHITGFKIFLMFTDVHSGNMQMTAEEWKEAVGYAPENFSIKLYFGPNFCQSFDIVNPTGDKAGTGNGYYSSNNEKYTLFEQIGEGDHISDRYGGFGYKTGGILLSPLNSTTPDDKFKLYVYIKFNPNGNADITTSNEGSYYFVIDNLPDLALEYNTIHHIVLAFDIEDLKHLIDKTMAVNAQSRTWLNPQKIDLKPFKIICE